HAPSRGGGAALVGAIGVVRGADADRAPAHGRAVGVGPLGEVERPPDDGGTGPVGAGLVDRLDLQPGTDQPRGGLTAGDVGREVGVLAQPGHGDAHQISIPNAAANLTSPSTMSRMSSMPCRNISVRSRPIPNANPV